MPFTNANFSLWKNANIGKLESTLSSFVSLGAAAKSDDFEILVDDVQNFLVQSSQIPEMKRNVLNSYGPHGVMVEQQGTIINAGSIQIGFREIVSGDSYAFLMKWWRDREYKKVTIRLTPEDSVTSTLKLVLQGCWIEVDPQDISVEDATMMVKPLGTLHYTWVDWKNALFGDKTVQ